MWSEKRQYMQDDKLEANVFGQTRAAPIKSECLSAMRQIASFMFFLYSKAKDSKFVNSRILLQQFKILWFSTPHPNDISERLVEIAQNLKGAGREKDITNYALSTGIPVCPPDVKWVSFWLI